MLVVVVVVDWVIHRFLVNRELYRLVMAAADHKTVQVMDEPILVVAAAKALLVEPVVDQVDQEL
jgi:hypothetical protein